jgi:hypothetical protein
MFSEGLFRADERDEKVDQKHAGGSQLTYVQDWRLELFDQVIGLHSNIQMSIAGPAGLFARSIG